MRSIGGANEKRKASSKDKPAMVRIEKVSIVRHCRALSTRNGAVIIRTTKPIFPEFTAETATGEIEYKSAAAAVRNRLSLNLLSKR